jgi:predicted component of type VI protein secretion system
MIRPHTIQHNRARARAHTHTHTRSTVRAAVRALLLRLSPLALLLRVSPLAANQSPLDIVTKAKERERWVRVISHVAMCRDARTRPRKVHS